MSSPELPVDFREVQTDICLDLGRYLTKKMIAQQGIKRVFLMGGQQLRGADYDYSLLLAFRSYVEEEGNDRNVWIAELASMSPDIASFGRSALYLSRNLMNTNEDFNLVDNELIYSLDLNSRKIWQNMNGRIPLQNPLQRTPPFARALDSDETTLARILVEDALVALR